jgi:DNA polymerase-1
MEIVAKDGNYWSEEEEVEIILALRTLLTHKNCRLIGQNWPYDTQYIAKGWHFIPNVWWDTMTVHHSMFSTLPKGLDFQSSLYLEDHVYWKDEGKEWNLRTVNEEQLWVYNCKDATRTFRIQKEQESTHAKMSWPSIGGMTALERQMALHVPITKAMIRGVKTDEAQKKSLQILCNDQIKKREEFLSHVVGYPLNPRSPKQLTGFFYYECRVPTIRNHKTGSPTCDEDALHTIGQRYAVLRPITDAINEIRSLGTFRAVAASPISGDGRVRCQYSIPGTTTFRFASSTDAFGDGLNLQNVSKGNVARLAQVYPEGIPPHVAIMPNMRTMMVPDPGMEIGDFDLAQADAQVVAAEANDADLLDLFLDPDRDLHNENCELLFGPGSYKDKTRRQMAKTGVHLTNYAGTAYILSRTLGISVYEAEKFQDIWFTAHPGIASWHERTLKQLMTKRFVENKFGYRIYYFDRIEHLLKEALAWVPQSTVAIVTNTGILAVDSDEECRKLGIQFLMQVHDSAVFQYPISNAPICRELIKQKMRVPIPYPKPLIISVGGSFSEKSWGDCD